MKVPSQRTTTIGEMIEFAATANGFFKKGRNYHLVHYILSNIEELKPLSSIPWISRKWAIPAWREIQRIGISDRLELLAPNQTFPPNEPRFPSSRIRQLCGLIGLGFNKINGRIVITRQTYTEKSKTKCQADL